MWSAMLVLMEGNLEWFAIMAAEFQHQERCSHSGRADDVKVKLY